MLPFRGTSCNLFDKSERFPRLAFVRGNLQRGTGRTACAPSLRSGFRVFSLPGFRSSPFVGSLALSFVKRLTACAERFAFDVAGAFNGLRLAVPSTALKLGRPALFLLLPGFPLTFILRRSPLSRCLFILRRLLLSRCLRLLRRLHCLRRSTRRRFPFPLFAPANVDAFRTFEQGKKEKRSSLERSGSSERRKRRTVKQGKGKRRERRESPAGSGKRSTGRKADCVAMSRRTGRKADCVENGVVFAFGAFLRRDAAPDGKSQETR